MGHVELEHFEQILQTMLTDLERRLLNRDGITIEHTPDALDEVQYATERESAIRQLEQDSDRLRDVNGALRRIEEGGYGACLHCGSAISIKRLKAVPWTSCCLDCQDVADQQTAGVEPAVAKLTERGTKGASATARQSRLNRAARSVTHGTQARGPELQCRCLTLASQNGRRPNFVPKAL